MNRYLERCNYKGFDVIPPKHRNGICYFAEKKFGISVSIDSQATQYEIEACIDAAIKKYQGILDLPWQILQDVTEQLHQVYEQQKSYGNDITELFYMRRRIEMAIGRRQDVFDILPKESEIRR